MKQICEIQTQNGTYQYTPAIPPRPDFPKPDEGRRILLRHRPTGSEIIVAEPMVTTAGWVIGTEAEGIETM